MDMQQLSSTVQQVQHKLQQDMAEVGQVLERMIGRRQAALPWRPGSQEMVSPSPFIASCNPAFAPPFTLPNSPPNNPPFTPFFHPSHVLCLHAGRPAGRTH